MKLTTYGKLASLLSENVIIIEEHLNHMYRIKEIRGLLNLKPPNFYSHI